MIVHFGCTRDDNIVYLSDMRWFESERGAGGDGVGEGGIGGVGAGNHLTYRAL